MKPWKSRNQEESSLDAVSINPLEPVLFKLSFLGCVLELEIYAIFSVETLHIIHIGVSNLIKEFLWDRLRSCEKIQIVPAKKYVK